MNKARTVTIIVAIVGLTVVNAYGQKEHLEPARDFKSYDGVLRAYYDSVFALLYTGFNDKPFARYTSMPSFSKEHAFSVEEKDGSYFIISNSLTESFWYSKKRARVRANTSTAEISKELFDTIGDLFQLLAEQTKKPEVHSMGMDGTTYYFATTGKDGNTKIGETWSPNKKTLLQRLVAVCNKLYAIGKGGEKAETELQIKIDKLIDELKK